MTEERATDGLVQVVEGLRRAAVGSNRSDLDQRLAAAATRVSRPTVVVAVVGEFKQGKSSLVNALLGAAVCPVEDDLATSVVTVVHHHPEPQVTVRRRQGQQVVAEVVPAAELAALATEAGNPGNEQEIDRVDIGLPHPLLASGLTLVDTPGMGGLGAGAAAMTLGFLPWADAVVFVTDASAELTRAELDLLSDASELCPSVTIALTKTDLYAEWPRIAQLDAARLAPAGITADLVPVSSVVRLLAVERDDPSLERESGIPALHEHIDRVVAGAKDDAARRAAADASSVLAQLRDGYVEERSALEDPTTAAATADRLDAAAERLDRLREASSRWSTVLNDRVADLNSEITHSFRGGMRAMQRAADEQIEAIDDDEGWEELARQLQADVSSLVAGLVQRVDQGAVEVYEAVAATVADELGEAALPTHSTTLDVDGLWRSPTTTTSPVQRLVDGLSVVRSAQGGIFMLGMMGRFMPAAAASVVLANPVMAGFGVLFAGQAIADQRKRKVAARRQQVRTNVRQFLDDVQFEAGHELSRMLVEHQRTLRDELNGRIGELQRTCTEAAARAREAAETESAQRSQRLEQVRQRLDALDRLESALAQACSAVDAP